MRAPVFEIMVRCGRCERDAVEGSNWCATHQPKSEPEPLTISAMVREAHANSRARGWWPTEEFSIPEKLCLVHSEASEALEAFRERPGENLAVREVEMVDCWCSEETVAACTACGGEGVLYKPVGFVSELADVLIRVGDLAGRLGIDLEAAVSEKMAFNRKRPHRHGGKAC